MKHNSENTTNNNSNFHTEDTNMNNSTENTNNMDQTTTTPEHLDYQDMPDIAQLKEGFPFCKSAKIGNLLYPVIASSKLMEFIAFDDNFVAAAREVKHHAFNPSGSEHGVVKKVCDMFIDNPSFREIICQDLIQGIYDPERIASDSVFKAKYRTFPRGFKYTANQIVQEMIMQVVRLSFSGTFSVPRAWSTMRSHDVNMMIEDVDRIRKRGFKCWISLRLKSFLDNIPHDRLMQKISIMFQDKRVANLVCNLIGLNTPSAGGSQTKHVGIPKDNPLTDLLAYELYLSELDQEIKRLGLTHVRHNDEIVVFCENKEAAEQIRGTLVAFVKNEMKCPIDHNRTRIKDIARLAFFGLSLQGGRWRIQYRVKNQAASDFIILLLAYGRFQEEHYLWSAYRKLTKFISRYEDVYALENEIQRLKKWRDDHFTHIVAFVEKVKLGLIKLPEW